jgi:hypothetical protein
MDGRSLRCATCYRRARKSGHGGRSSEPQRTIDAARILDSTWRPPHLPPACGSCRGFGYQQLYDERTHRSLCHTCPDCREHPGSSMTHDAWTAQRVL